MYVLWFDQITNADIALVGGKNASLGEMTTMLQEIGSIKVPFGFAVTAQAFDDFLNFNNINIENLIQDFGKKNKTISDLANFGKKLREKINNGKFPDTMKSEILEAFHKLNCEVAVRSSSTAEDMPDASFAGQQDTYLNVGESDLFNKIRQCFASLYNDRAISYRSTTKYGNCKISLSVAIQKMVRSDKGSAGVAFSLDTETGFDKVIVINGAFGLGELVVGGNIQPDEFIIFKEKMTIIDKKLGSKKMKMIYGKSGTIEIETSEEERNRFCLTEENIRLLGNWVSLIENHYQCFVDIEWAFDGEELYIVQARPETVHSNKDKTKMIQYSFPKNQEKKLLFSGIAVGDKIATGKVRKMEKITDLFEEGDVLVTDITNPDWEPIMKKASAIVTNKGGRTCHAAIVARELGVTAIVGSDVATKVLENNQKITVSCGEGEVGFVYEGEYKYDKREIDLKSLPKSKTKIMFNLAAPGLAFKFAQLPNSGVGLVREEFIINNYIKVHPLALLHPDKIDQQTRDEIKKLTVGYETPLDYYISKLAYGIGRIGAAFYPNDVIVRFSDFKSNEYKNLLGGKFFEPDEENPMIGWRGASRYYSDTFKEAFGLECNAIKKVREEMKLTNVIVMIPFCRTTEEFNKVIDVMEEFKLTRENGLKVYIMCEVPSNVILAEEFCKIVDGFSIGSNDLTQLTLGLDRDSHLVSHIYNERNPAVKKMLEMVITTAKKNNVKIGICGQGPSDYPDFANFLVDMGIDSISITPDALYKTLEATKQ